MNAPLGIIVCNRRSESFQTLSFQIHGVRLCGKARARNGEQALEDCLWLQFGLHEDLVHRHVKEPISFECHRSRLSAIKSKRISHRVSLGFEIEVKIWDGFKNIEKSPSLSSVIVVVVSPRSNLKGYHVKLVQGLDFRSGIQKLILFNKFWS